MREQVAADADGQAHLGRRAAPVRHGILRRRGAPAAGEQTPRRRAARMDTHRRRAARAGARTAVARPHSLTAAARPTGVAAPRRACGATCVVCASMAAAPDEHSLLIVGGGRMGEALLGGLIAAGRDGGDLAVAEVSPRAARS